MYSCTRVHNQNVAACDIWLNAHTNMVICQCIFVQDSRTRSTKGIVVALDSGMKLDSVVCAKFCDIQLELSFNGYFL